MKSSFKRLEEMINSFPPTYDLLKTVLIAEIKTLEEEYVPKQTSVSWGVDDFESQAQINEEASGEDMYDRSKFEEGLLLMIKNHDASNGISWGTVDYYLDNFCRLTINYK